MPEPEKHEPEPKPWYQRDVSNLLPKFIPPWLLVCVGLGGGLAFVATYLPFNGLNIYVEAALAFGLGFCGGVALLVYMAFDPRTETTPGLVPPLWLAGPVTIATVVGLGVLTVQAREFAIVNERDPLLKGPIAVIVGLLIILTAGGGSVWLLRWKPPRAERLLAGGLGLIISLAGLAFALVLAWRHLTR